jgi:EEF1A lysine methyltransferase 1
MSAIDSPRSVSSDLSDIPVLDPSTLAVLDSFLSEKATEKALLDEIISNSYEPEVSTNSMMSVDEYRRVFGEDWKLSQFW